MNLKTFSPSVPLKSVENPRHARRGGVSFWLFALLALPPATLTAAHEVRSPDSHLAVTVDCEGGKPAYRVTLEGQEILGWSPLGLEASLGDFTQGLSDAGVTTRQVRSHYTLPHGKVREVEVNQNELVLKLVKEGLPDESLEVVFRVGNHDVAFLQRLTSKSKTRAVVPREASGFRVPAGSLAFVTPQAPAGSGWMATKPSYEEPYQVGIPVEALPASPHGFTFPSLFRVGETAWVLISETGVTSGYAGCHLSERSPDGLYRVAFPMAGENAGVGDATVAAAVPLETPWRTLTVGKTLAPIVESTVATDLVSPLYEPSPSLRPGRVAWSWLLWQDASMNEADQRAFVDFAAKIGFEYLLIDALWDTQIGRENMERLVAYANGKNVGILLWYNSNGAWNDAPQSPRNLMDSAPVREREMAWLEKIGVKGLKVDFFGGDKQVTMKLYEDLLTDANRHGLMMNFHGTTLPRGWERLYPNHMTSEAVMASENLVFNQHDADREALNSTLLPFTRNAVAAMDFGPVLLNRLYSRDQKQGSVRRTTDAFQLATAVVYQSPLQHFGLVPNNLEEQPAFVWNFLRNVPVVWDETRLVDGYPGKHVVVSRRVGSRWYLAATNGESLPKTLKLSAPWLAGRKLTLLCDGDQARAREASLHIGSDGSFELTLAAQGGAVGFEP